MALRGFAWLSVECSGAAEPAPTLLRASALQPEPAAAPHPASEAVIYGGA